MNLFAGFGGEEMIGLVCAVLTLSTPIVWMLLSHQRKMAELLRGSGGGMEANPDFQILRGEIINLKQQVQDLTISLDRLSTEFKSQSADLRDRLREQA